MIEDHPGLSIAINRLRRVAERAIKCNAHRGHASEIANEIRQYTLGHHKVTTIPDHYVSDVTRWIEERFL